MNNQNSTSCVGGTTIEQVRALASGTFATLIGDTRYAVIDQVRAEFIEFVERTDYPNWVQAWDAFVAEKANLSAANAEIEDALQGADFADEFRLSVKVSGHVRRAIGRNRAGSVSVSVLDASDPRGYYWVGCYSYSYVAACIANGRPLEVDRMAESVEILVPVVQ